MIAATQTDEVFNDPLPHYDDIALPPCPRPPLDYPILAQPDMVLDEYVKSSRFLSIHDGHDGVMNEWLELVVGK